MRKLSLAAMISAILYLVAGVGILLFQDVFKPMFIGNAGDYVTVYPVDSLLRLALIGLPCAVLGAVNITGSHSKNKILPLGIAIYSGVVLGLQSILGIMFSTVNSVAAARFGGAMYLANLSIVNQLFNWIQVFCNIALVLLLVAGVMGFCEKKNTQNY